jgi:hypothetical protein
MSLLDSIPEIVRATLGELVFSDATITRVASKVADARGGFVETPAEPEPCKAIVTTYSDFIRAAGNIGADERKVIIIGKGLSSPPSPSQVVAIEAENWQIVEVSRDPSGAVYTCKSKRIKVS